MDGLHSGRCLCGAVTYAFEGEPLWRAHCHCESCRRATSSPFTTFFGLRDGTWRFTGAEPRRFESSPGVRRYFCGACGSPVAYAADRFPEETHFYAASLDNPAGFAPQGHVNTDEQLPWIRLDDGLPRKGGIG